MFRFLKRFRQRHSSNPYVRGFARAGDELVGDPVTEALAAYRFCPCTMKPCDCVEGGGCADPEVELSAADVDSIRATKVELGRQLQFLRKVIFDESARVERGEP